jgi:hypothetical protein
MSGSSQPQGVGSWYHMFTFIFCVSIVHIGIVREQEICTTVNSDSIDRNPSIRNIIFLCNNVTLTFEILYCMNEVSV